MTGKRARDFFRQLLSGAAQEAPDSQRRVTIPPMLREWAALDRELLRKPVSTLRLGDAVREDGKAADDVYEQILIAP